MTYNSILHITGIKKEVILPYSKAIELDKILQDPNYSNDFSIRLQGMTFRKGAVKFLEVNRDGGAGDDHQEYAQKFYNEERDNRKKYLLWDKARLATFTEPFQILFEASSGGQPSALDISKAQQIQLSFFQQNKNRTLCDLHLFKPIIPMKRSTMDIWRSGMVKLLERAVMRDMHLANAN